jgi:hypothetical protein
MNQNIQFYVKEYKRVFNFPTSFSRKLLRLRIKLSGSEEKAIKDLLVFANIFEDRYDIKISRYFSVILIDKMTPKRHFIRNIENLNGMFKYFDITKERSKNIVLTKSVYSKERQFVDSIL